MRPVEADTLRLLSHMPLLDRLEAVALSGWSRGAVYGSFEALEREGLAASVPHASELTAATRRYRLTADGLRRLAREEDATVDGLLGTRPVSNQWLRVLMERLDAVGVVYRLASAISTLAHPLRLRWYRALPMDAAVALPDGRVIAVVRQGPATDRTGFSKRLWRLREGAQPAAALLLTPDETRLRHARRLLAGAPSIAYLALERDAASAGGGSRRLAHALRGRARRPSHRPRPHRAERTLARRAAAGAGGPPRRPRRRGRGGLGASDDAQARGETRPGPHRRLALAHPRPPGSAHRAEALQALRGRRAAHRPGPRAGRRRRGTPPSCRD